MNIKPMQSAIFLNRQEVDTKTISSFDGTKIFYRISKGAGLPVLLIHGLSGSSSAFNYIFDYLSNRNMYVIAMDLRGHGMSGEEKAGRYLIRSYSEDVNEILKNEGIDRVNLVGHCFGGIVVQDFIRDYHDKVNKIILISTVVNTKDKLNFKINRLLLPILYFITSLNPAKSFRVKRYEHNDYNKYKKDNDWYLPRLLRDWYITSFPVVLKTLKNLLKIDYSDELSKLKCETLIIHGKKDSIFHYKNAYSINRLVENSELMFFDDGLHTIPLQKKYHIETVIFKYFNTQPGIS